MLCALRRTEVRTHNGQVAIAYPVQGMEIHGNLPEGPTELPWHPVSHKSPRAPLGAAEDFSARFKAGYTPGENAL